VISAPVPESPRSGAGVGGEARVKESDAEVLAVLVEVSRREHGGRPLGQREIVRVLSCGFPKARRLAELLGWVEPKDSTEGDEPADSAEEPVETDAESNQNAIDEAPELETSSTR
jgi:hypothetical protein